MKMDEFISAVRGLGVGEGAVFLKSDLPLTKALLWIELSKTGYQTLIIDHEDNFEVMRRYPEAAIGGSI